MNGKAQFYNQANDVLALIPKERIQDILRRRFGFKNNKSETLESIGRDYKITRERVRQIENAGFKIIMEQNGLQRLGESFDYMKRKLEKSGGIKRDVDFLEEMSGGEKRHKPAISFILTLGSFNNIFHYHKEDNDFYGLWASDQQNVEFARNVLYKLLGYFEKIQKVCPKNKVLQNQKEIIGDKNKIPSHVLENYIRICKHIGENDFNELGLLKWSEIKPRGVRDKAYVVLKQQGAPLHFREIAKLIGKVNKNWGKAHPQTVHNELIKDNRFVLVGRGIYGLEEWGHIPGTVKDVIRHILEKEGPMGKDDIIKTVTGIRMVKPNTVLINLQNNANFVRLEDGRYNIF